MTFYTSLVCGIINCGVMIIYCADDLVVEAAGHLISSH